MSITVVSEGGMLRVVASDAAIPEGVEMQLLTPDEIEHRLAQRIWLAIPPESRIGMLMQTTSKSYQDWMDEEVWDKSVVKDSPASSLPLQDFKP
jgi:hypothetical protein